MTVVVSREELRSQCRLSSILLGCCITAFFLLIYLMSCYLLLESSCLSSAPIRFRLLLATTRDGAASFGLA